MVINLAVVGACGRMGQVLMQAAVDLPDFALVAALEKIDSDKVGLPLSLKNGTFNDLTISDDIKKALSRTDVLIDFSHPEATLHYLKACQEYKVPMVIGTTGFTNRAYSLIKEVALSIPVVLSPNFSVGVNLMLKLLKITASTLGQAYDVDILEVHHRRKADAPSGTALEMGQVIAQAFNWDFAVPADIEKTPKALRSEKTISFSSVRAGNIVGEHTAWFIGEEERLEITHKASDRITFAKGALRAASWVVGKNPSLYSMQDVIG